MFYIDFPIFIVVSEAKNQVDLTRSECELLSITEDLAHVTDFHPAFSINLIATACEEVVLQLLDVDVHDATASQVKSHLVKVVCKVGILDLIVAELHDVVSE